MYKESQNGVCVEKTHCGHFLPYHFHADILFFFGRKFHILSYVFKKALGWQSSSIIFWDFFFETWAINTSIRSQMPSLS